MKFGHFTTLKQLYNSVHIMCVSGIG